MVFSEIVKRNMDMAHTFNNRVMEMWMVNLGGLNWVSDRCESIVNSSLKYYRTAYEETVTLLNEMGKHTKGAQEQCLEIAKETMQTLVGNYKTMTETMGGAAPTN
ncbi:MAG: hypothetical protein ACM3UZ_09650 [Acidobacteriota bacterium]